MFYALKIFSKSSHIYNSYVLIAYIRTKTHSLYVCLPNWTCSKILRFKSACVRVCGFCLHLFCNFSCMQTQKKTTSAPFILGTPKLSRREARSTSPLVVVWRAKFLLQFEWRWKDSGEKKSYFTSPSYMYLPFCCCLQWISIYLFVILRFSSRGYC